MTESMFFPAAESNQTLRVIVTSIVVLLVAIWVYGHHKHSANGLSGKIGYYINAVFTTSLIIGLPFYAVWPLSYGIFWMVFLQPNSVIDHFSRLDGEGWLMVIMGGTFVLGIGFSVLGAIGGIFKR